MRSILLLLACAFGFLLVVPLEAQPSVVIDGVVRLGDAPVADVPVELHRVTRDAAGVVSRTTSDDLGSFHFETGLRQPEGGFVVHFATARFRDVRYFGPPVHGADRVDPYLIEVFDTVHAEGAAVSPVVARRDVVLIPEPRGGWEVNELIVVRNPGNRTLVSPAGMPIWEFRLPDGVEAFEVGEADLAPESVSRMGNRVLLTEALQPGNRDLLLRYRMAGGRGEASFPVDQPTDLMNLLIRQPSPSVDVVGLGEGGEISVEGERFVRFGGTDLMPGTAPTLRWRGGDASPVSPVGAALGVLGLLLLISAIYAYRRREVS